MPFGPNLLNGVFIDIVARFKRTFRNTGWESGDFSYDRSQGQADSWTLGPDLQREFLNWLDTRWREEGDDILGSQVKGACNATGPNQNSTSGPSCTLAPCGADARRSNHLEEEIVSARMAAKGVVLRWRAKVEKLEREYDQKMGQHTPPVGG